MPFLQVTHLRYRYPDGTLALDGVSFAIDAGERVGLIGPNGAGKSTLLWHLNGLLPERWQDAARADTSASNARTTTQHGKESPRDGAQITVAGLAVCEKNLPPIRRLVGLVFQDPDDQLFCPTVREDVAFGPIHLGLDADEVARRVHEALVSVGLSGCEDRLPHHLSLGERRRACLAGVLACQPQLLALDEPTANLDPRGRRQLLGILGGLPCAQLIASHDLEMILSLATRVILLDGGQIHADGPTRQILADERLMLEHGLECPPSLRAG